MPLYEYQCTKCKHRFEIIQRFSDPPKTKCPECGAKLEKLISAPAIQFKGSGWYVTDYGKGNDGPRKDKEQDKGKDSDKTAAGAETTSDSESKPSGKQTDAGAGAGKKGAKK